MIEAALRGGRHPAAWKLLRKTAGFRYVMDVVPLDSGLVRGSHGRFSDRPRDGPLLISSSSREKTSRFEMTEVSAVIEETIIGGGGSSAACGGESLQLFRGGGH